MCLPEDLQTLNIGWEGLCCCTGPVKIVALSVDHRNEFRSRQLLWCYLNTTHIYNWTVNGRHAKHLLLFLQWFLKHEFYKDLGKKSFHFDFSVNILCVVATPMSNNDISLTVWRASFFSDSNTSNAYSSVTTYGHPASSFHSELYVSM